MQIFLFFKDSIGTYLKQIWFYLSRVRFSGYSNEYSSYAFGTCLFILPFLKNYSHKINRSLNMFRFYEVIEIYKNEKITGGL